MSSARDSRAWRTLPWRGFSGQWRPRVLMDPRRRRPPGSLDLRVLLIGVLVIGAFLLTGCAPGQEGETFRRPNILLIIDDQHHPRAMGWTGTFEIQTPHLDRLASQSAAFTSAYTASPVCAPARHSIYSGLYASEHGVLTNDREMNGSVKTFITMLKENGYTTASIGKLHRAPYHDRMDFQYALNHEFFNRSGGNSHYYPYMLSEIARRGLQPGKPLIKDGNWTRDPRQVAGENWIPTELTSEAWTTDQAIVFMQNQRENRPDKPFLLHTGYFPPHHPYAPTREFRRRYDPAKIQMPPNFSLEKFNRWWPKLFGTKPATLEEVRYMRAHYLAYVTQLDAEIGRLLEGLRTNGFADNTLVIFTSDHGDLLGEHGRFYKGSMYEGSVGVPMMIRYPDMQKGVKIDTPVSHLDIMPTILAAAGIQPHRKLPGRDLGPAAHGLKELDDRPVYSEFIPRLPFSDLMIRKRAYKLIASWDAEEEEVSYDGLYDVVADPWEMHDLKKSHPSIFSELRDDLLGHWEAQKTFLPDRYPPEVPRVPYDIRWPADPWKPVRPWKP